MNPNSRGELHPSVTVSCPIPRGARARDTACVVVRLHGEHDVSTVAELSETMSRAVALDDSDIVVDLGDVQFMGAATIRVILQAKELLRAQSRRLVLRSPPRSASRVLELCGEAELLGPAGAAPITGAVGALTAWGPGPDDNRAAPPANTSLPTPARAPATVSPGMLSAAVGP